MVPTIMILVMTASYAPHHANHNYKTTAMPFCVTFVLPTTMAVHASRRKHVLQSSTATEQKRQLEPAKTYD